MAAGRLHEAEQGWAVALAPQPRSLPPITLAAWQRDRAQTLIWLHRPAEAAPLLAQASSWAASASTNRLTAMPAACSRPTSALRPSCWPATSSPPSVVTSSRFSGTRVTMSGRMRRAIASIAGVAAISRLRRLRTVARSSSTSRSWMWRRSSRKCTVMPSAPPNSASRA
jgi:hypothetical protein